MFKVLIPEDITEAGKEYLRNEGYEVVVMDHPTEEEICEAVKDCVGLISRNIYCSRKIMSAGKTLKVVGSHGVGVDQIDVEAATELGIQVTNAPRANTNSVAEHTLALMLGCANHILKLDRAARNGEYGARNTCKALELEGLTIGIIGCGRIGQLVAQKAVHGLDMKAIGLDAFIPEDKWPAGIERRTTLEEVVKEADVISLHVPATKETMNMFNKEIFKLMKPNAILVNCARGGVINEEDLYEALVKGEIAAAGLDVFAQEPVQKDNKLFTLDKVIASPHCAGLSIKAMDKMGLDAAKGIVEVMKGKTPTWPVNKLK